MHITHHNPERIGWLLSLIALVLLTACNTAAAASEAPSQPVAGQPAEPDPVEAEEKAELVETEEPTEDEPVEAVVGEANIMTEDDRPDNLRSITASWGTDWNRHTVDYAEIISGGPPRDGIRSIENPPFIDFEEAGQWLAPTEPVIALEIDGDARAYPLQILTRHEIVNDVVGDVPVAVTFCPLCNSGIVFDRRVGDEVYEFGVSGLLRNSDLIMYDRTTESLWQQFTGEGIVGLHAGDQLDILPSSIVSFADFMEAFPAGQVQSTQGRGYGNNPYVGYDSIGNEPFLFRGPTDDRLPSMMRVVGVTIDDMKIAYPYNLLWEVGVINDTQYGQDLVIFHKFGTNSALGAAVIANAEDVGATGVFDPHLNGQKLTFILTGDGEIVDEQTGSTWNLLGQATGGELAGEQLEDIVHSDHFWFSWAAFFPDTRIYQSDATG